MAESTEKLNKNGNRRGMSPNSRKNLDMGRKGNNHANKDYSITRIVKEMLDQPASKLAMVLSAAEVGATPEDNTWRKVIARAILLGCAKGEHQLIKELLDRVEGKVTQPVANEGEITLRVKYDDSD